MANNDADKREGTISNILSLVQSIRKDTSYLRSNMYNPGQGAGSDYPVIRVSWAVWFGTALALTALLYYIVLGPSEAPQFWVLYIGVFFSLFVTYGLIRFWEWLFGAYQKRPYSTWTYRPQTSSHWVILLLLLLLLFLTLWVWNPSFNWLADAKANFVEWIEDNSPLGGLAKLFRSSESRGDDTSRPEDDTSDGPTVDCLELTAAQCENHKHCSVDDKTGECYDGPGGTSDVPAKEKSALSSGAEGGTNCDSETNDKGTFNLVEGARVKRNRIARCWDRCPYYPENCNPDLPLRTGKHPLTGVRQ